MERKSLDTILAKQHINLESANTLNVQSKGITCIDDNLLDIVNKIRKFDISFNYLSSLQNITSQMPALRILIAYCCCITDIEDLVYGKFL